MKFAIVQKLVLAAMLSASIGFVSACAKKENNQAEAEQVRAQKARLDILQAELDQSKADLENQKLKSQHTIKALSVQKATWEKSREDRELQLIDLTQKISDEKRQLEKTQESYKAITAKLTLEKSNLESSIKSLGEQKTAVEVEIAKINADSQAKATDTQIKLADANNRLEDVKTQQQQLNSEKERLSTLNTNLLALKDNLDSMSKLLAEKEAKFQADVATTRELFAKEGLGDALVAVESDSVTPFLISVIGTGKPEFQSAFAKRIAAINTSGKVHSSIGSVEKGKNIIALAIDKSMTSEKNEAPLKFVGVDDHFVIHAPVSKVKALRDTLNQMMTDENSKGAAPEETSLFVIARPISKVRTTMKMSLIGSEASTPDGRDSTKFAEFNFPTSESSLIGLAAIDMADPSTYAFGNEVNKACSVIGAECIKALRGLGVLEEQQTLSAKDSSSAGTMKNVTYREVLAMALKASMDQIADDQTPKTLLGISNDPTRGLVDGIKLEFNTEELTKSVFGSGRAKTIDAIKIRYVVKMVDQINNTGNYLDSVKYMFNGFIDGFGLASKRKSRNEIEIELPIQMKELKTSQSNFPDLTMSDWTFEKPAPKAPVNDTSTWYQNSPAMKKYESELATWEIMKDEARNKEYKRRLYFMVSMQLTMLDQLK